MLHHAVGYRVPVSVDVPITVDTNEETTGLNKHVLHDFVGVFEPIENALLSLRVISSNHARTAREPPMNPAVWRILEWRPVF